MLELNGVAYAHPGHDTLFANVDLRAELGSFTALAGPSGTGKSTLLALIAGLLTPTQGVVHWAPPKRPTVTWVPQTLASLPARSVIDNVMLGSIYRPQRCSERRQEAQTALEGVRLAHRAHTRARHLSGGELQRMVVARALVSGADVILADEPTNQNDRKNARRVLAALESYADGPNRFVIVATHDVHSLPARARAFELSPDGLQRLTTSTSA